MNTTTSGAPAPAPLAFRRTAFHPITREGQPWLTAAEIGSAMGYLDDKSIHRAYARHREEFTEHMAGVVKLTTPSGEQDVRIFSLRGAHLLAMFSRTPVAAEFRRWVLDLLDQEAAKPQTTEFPPEIPSVLPGEINARQFAILERLLRERAPSNPGLGAFIHIVGRRFGIARLKHLPAARFVEACEYLLAHPLPNPRIPVSRPHREPAPRNALVNLTDGGTAPRGSRWLVMVTSEGKLYGEQVPEVSDGTFTADPATLPDIIREPGGCIPRATLPKIIEACVSRMQ